MQVSIIIPTYNRVKDLDECLDSIIIQTKLPKGILIVDDSDNDEVESLVGCRKNEFSEKDIFLRYIRNKKEKGLTIARNIGIENATGDIVLFLDSDVILDKNYIEEIVKVYKEKPDAVGVQGFIKNAEEENRLIPIPLMEGYNRLFYIGQLKKNDCGLLPSLGIIYPSSVDKIIDCEWLSGANQSYKKEILEEFKFDENLKKYSLGEDQDLSYRIFKKYPGTLFMTPHAKLIHKASAGGRHLKKDLIYMKEIYPLYLFYKIIDQNLKNKLIYLWSRMGRIIFNILFSIFKSKSKLTEIKYRIGATFYCMRHIKEIKRGDLEFFNRSLR